MKNEKKDIFNNNHKCKTKKNIFITLSNFSMHVEGCHFSGTLLLVLRWEFLTTPPLNPKFVLESYSIRGDSDQDLLPYEPYILPIDIHRQRIHVQSSDFSLLHCWPKILLLQLPPTVTKNFDCYY